MKRILIPVAGLLMLVVTACNNTDKKKSEVANDDNAGKTATSADSLYKDVIKGHDEAMRGWMHLEGKKKEINQLLDSIAKLPAKAKSTAEQLRIKLTETNTELQSAYDEMDKWMNEINLDSAKDNLEQRIKYFTEEKLKVSKVKEAINNSLQKADSLLKARL